MTTDRFVPPPAQAGSSATRGAEEEASQPPAIDGSSRRGFLRRSAGAAGAAAATTVSPVVLARRGPQYESTQSYRPGWFQQPEWAFIVAAAARLIPSDEKGPGAIEAGVPVFIDLQLQGEFGQATDWYMSGPHQPEAEALFGYQLADTPAQLYRRAIAAIDQACRNLHGKAFAELTPQLQDDALEQLSKGALLSDKSLAREFFALLLVNTKEGYFSDPMYGGNRGMQSWKMIGFPGARAAFLDWADVTDHPYPLGPVSIHGDRA